MRALPLLLLFAAGCLRTAAFSCDEATDCIRQGIQGTCEGTGFCSFPDTSCQSGSRYGDLSGSYSNNCVGDGTNPDGMPDTPLPDDDDDDNDGVLDVSDNCPLIANAMQHDEDGDALGDVCDPCPPSSNNTDGDSDGVGDACDPNPTTTGDVLVAFEGFHTGIPAGADVAGTFTAANGSITSPATGGWRLTIPVPATASTGRETVTTSATVVAVMTANDPAIGVVNRQTAGSSTGVVCTLFHVNGTNGLTLINAANLSDNSNTTYEMTVGQTYQLDLGRTMDQYRCVARRGGTMASLNRNFTINPATPSFGVIGQAATGRYAWIMMVRSP